MGNDYKIKYSYDMISKMLSLIECSKKKFAFFQLYCLFWGALYTAAALVFPNAISKIIDQVAIDKKYNLIEEYLLAIIFSGAFMILFNYIQYMSYYKFGQRASIRLKQKLLEKVMKSGGRFKLKYTSGEMLRIIEQDTEQIQYLVGEGFGQLIVNVLVFIAVMILLLIQQMMIGVVMISISILFSMLHFYLSNQLKKDMVSIRQELGRTSSYTNEIINHSEQVIVSGYVKKFVNDFYQKNRIILDKNISQMKKSLFGRNLGIAYNVIANAITLGIGIYSVRNGKMTVGSLLAISMYVQRLYGPLISISNSYINIKKAIPFIEKIAKVLDNNDIISDGNLKPRYVLKGNIHYQNVFFKYEINSILRNFNLKIEEGKFTAIRGENGSGKSTLIKLLLKIYKCYSGKIYMDGIDINEYSNEYYYNNISVMFQNNFVVSGRLYDIINPGGRNIDKKNIYKLFDEVKLDIKKFENGLDTYICENNINISGGELQKINIIRILIENRPIVILDEPTSALDKESESEICDLLGRILKGKTVIIVTHRERILEICDHIINFDDLNECLH